MTGVLGDKPVSTGSWAGVNFLLTEVGMAGRRSPVTDIREILRRLQLGEPDRRMARAFGASHNTLAALLRA